MKTSQDAWRNLTQPDDAATSQRDDACRTRRGSWLMLLGLALGVGAIAGAIVVILGDSPWREGASSSAFFTLTTFGGLVATRDSSCGRCRLTRWFRRRGAQQGGEMTEHNA